jgi:hypothetical protein
LSETGGSLEKFYVDFWHELDEFIHGRKPTAAGSAVILKRVALAHGIRVANDLPLPRLTRGEREHALSEEP